MGKVCAVLHCDSISCSKADGITYHRFPINNPKLLPHWQIITGRDRSWEPKICHFVCSVHFDPECFIDGPSLRRLRPNSFPTRIKLSALRNRQPLQSAYIERKLLSQPGVTKVDKDAVVVCEFDKDAIDSFKTSFPKNKQKNYKKRTKNGDDDDDEVDSDDENEKSLSDEDQEEMETDVVWDSPVKEEQDDPLLVEDTLETETIIGDLLIDKTIEDPHATSEGPDLLRQNISHKECSPSDDISSTIPLEIESVSVDTLNQDITSEDDLSLHASVDPLKNSEDLLLLEIPSTDPLKESTNSKDVNSPSKETLAHEKSSTNPLQTETIVMEHSSHTATSEESLLPHTTVNTLESSKNTLLFNLLTGPLEQTSEIYSQYISSTNPIHVETPFVDPSNQATTSKDILLLDLPPDPLKQTSKDTLAQDISPTNPLQVGTAFIDPSNQSTSEDTLQPGTTLKNQLQADSLCNLQINTENCLQ